MNTHPVITEFRKTFPIEHYYCEDPWYSCPKSAEGCANDNAGKDCNCGAIKKQEKIESFILTALQKQREEFLGMIGEDIENIPIEPKDTFTKRIAEARYKNEFRHELREKVKGEGV